MFGLTEYSPKKKIKVNNIQLLWLQHTFGPHVIFQVCRRQENVMPSRIHASQQNFETTCTNALDQQDAQKNIILQRI